MKAILFGQNKFTLQTSTKVWLAPWFTVQLYSSIKWAKRNVCATSLNKNAVTCSNWLGFKNVRKGGNIGAIYCGYGFSLYCSCGFYFVLCTVVVAGVWQHHVWRTGGQYFVLCTVVVAGVWQHHVWRSGG